MDFQVELHKIEQALCKDETEALAFLCRDIIDTDLSKMVSASHLFTKLKNMDLLEEEDYFIVAELLYRIRQFYLIKKMGKSKEQVEKELPQKGRISNYRQLLYDLSEDITRDDLKSVKFLLQNSLPRCRLEDDMTMLKLLIQMEKEDLLDRSNLETLEKVLQIISPSLVKKITKYKNENGHCTQETGFSSSEVHGRNPSQPYAESQLPPLSHSSQEEESSSNSRSASGTRRASEDQQLSDLLLPLSVSASEQGEEQISNSLQVTVDNQIGNFEPSLSPFSGASDSNAVELEPRHPSSGFSSVNTDVAVGHGESADSNPWILETYTMNREKRGYCLIINNYDFSESRTRSGLEQKLCTDRRGTDADASALNNVFQWLGFDTVCLKDLTKKKILNEIEKYQNITDHKDRDCFVCCILSHGEKGKIYGTDGRAVLINEITKPFSGINCRLLIGKPKVFFIQACQGNEKQSGVPIEADGYTSELEEDDLVPDSIPEDADFLVGMATMEDYVSYRDISKGTWYIQSLCQNLLQLVPRKEDLLTILTKVNMDVSQKTDKRRLNKQIPQPAFSFRKKLVFPVPAERPPALLQVLESSITAV
ncbi:caspase-8-like isoform X2 [Acipenser oxyrinchus oxyrinchus]|uniref:Caspase-8 n=1 Tax=Acipenser oxyrinchus oxyrinchus TaxID=40147 RepID=A0AAD8G1V4_ACIOX|nr:caspase-8-like isoform X2 [Acipenser oxyrinchus oxyrinchus]